MTRIARMIGVLCAMLPGARGAWAQDEVPDRDALCDAIAAYRAEWESFEASYTVREHSFDRTHTDLLCVDRGRIYIDRRSSGSDVPPALGWDHYIRCFNGEETYTITPRDPEPDGVLITPGYDSVFMALTSSWCLLMGWLYEFRPPLDEVLRDPAWRTEQIAPGEEVNGLQTVLVELSQPAGVRQVMQYWLAPERNWLPVRRRLLVGDGPGGELRLLNEYQALSFREFEKGWFPMKMEWTSGGTLLASITVDNVSFTPGAFDAYEAAMISEPANVTDVVRDQFYQLAADEDFAQVRTTKDDTGEAVALARFFDGVSPRIAGQVREREAEYRRIRAAETPAAPAPSRGRWAWYAGGGVILLGMAGAVTWTMRRRLFD